MTTRDDTEYDRLEAHYRRIDDYNDNIRSLIEWAADKPTQPTKAQVRDMTNAMFDGKLDAAQLDAACEHINARISSSRPDRHYIVTVEHNGEKWPLRGTIWAFDMSRAQTFATREAAQAGLDRARKFMKAAIYRKAIIEEVMR